MVLLFSTYLGPCLGRSVIDKNPPFPSRPSLNALPLTVLAKSVNRVTSKFKFKKVVWTKRQDGGFLRIPIKSLCLFSFFLPSVIDMEQTTDKIEA